MTSKQRAYLISLAMKLDPVVSIGKTGLTPEITQAAEEALAARELIKIQIQRTAPEMDLRGTAQTLAERTHSEVVQTIGRKFVLYREGDETHRKIRLPRAGRSKE